MTPEGGFRVSALDVEVRSAVGAGDAFLAGLIFGLVRGRGWAASLATATASGAAACLAPGTSLGRASDALIGDPDDVLRRLRELRAMGFEYVLMLLPDDVQALRRFAREIMPELQGESASAA